MACSQKGQASLRTLAEPEPPTPTVTPAPARGRGAADVAAAYDPGEPSFPEHEMPDVPSTPQSAERAAHADASRRVQGPEDTQLLLACVRARSLLQVLPCRYCQIVYVIAATVYVA